MTYRTIFLFKALHDGLAQMPSRYAFVLRLFLRNGLTTDLKRTWNGLGTEVWRRAREVFSATFFYAFHLIYSLRELLQVSTHILTADAVYLRLGLC